MAIRPPSPATLHPPYWGPRWWRTFVSRVDPTFAALGALALALYLIAGARTSVHDITDSVLYRHIAGEPLSLGVLFENKRPFLYPLLIRLCGNHGHLVVAGQFAAYVGAWGFFAWTLYRPLRDAGRVVHGAMLAIVAFWIGLYPEFAGWNHLIMTESLSNAGLVAIAALLLRCVLDRSDRALYGAVAIALAVAVVRDASAYFSLFLIVVVAAFALLRRIGPRAAIVATVSLLLSYGFMNWSADHVHHDPMEGRWVFPMLNDFGQRVLTTPPVSAWFVAHGMPLDDALRAMTGKLSFEGAYEWQFYRDPKLETFRHWLVTDGKGLYQRYLLTHPGYVLRGVWGDRLDLWQPFGFRIPFYYDANYRFGLIPTLHLVWIDTFAAIASLVVLARGAIRHDRVEFVGGVLCVLLLGMVAPLAIVIDRADTMEIGRHGIALPLQLALVALLALFFLIAGRDAVTTAPVRAMPR